MLQELDTSRNSKSNTTTTTSSQRAHRLPTPTAHDSRVSTRSSSLSSSAYIPRISGGGGHTGRNIDTDKWIEIQKNTFTNWINEQLKGDGEHVAELRTDLSDGVRFVKLVNALQNSNKAGQQQQQQKKDIWAGRRSVKNSHHSLESIALALNAVRDDGVRLVNIGPTDIVNGNVKLILGLVWSLILHYQIGKSKMPPKKLILGWLKAILPQLDINNLTSDLNDGRVLA